VEKHAGEIFSKLGMSQRTLARRLSEEGLALTRVLQKLKLELVKRYLMDKDLTILEIASLLGYREPSPFTTHSIDGSERLHARCDPETHIRPCC
jgi:AraC-like DNA-binding protein